MAKTIENPRVQFYSVRPYHVSLILFMCPKVNVTRGAPISYILYPLRDQGVLGLDDFIFFLYMYLLK